MTLNIIHLTSVHSRYDPRIFYKMCIPLAKKEHNIIHVVADGKGNELKNNVKILDVGNTLGFRLLRMIWTVRLIYKKAIELDGDIYHLHDPELIPIGLKLKKLNKKVIFDAHEDYASKIESKNWIYPGFKKIISTVFLIYYSYSIRKFDGVIVAANTIKVHNDKKIVFRNLSALNLKKNKVFTKDSDNVVLYTGGITENRGIEQVIKALIHSEFKNWKLVILGKESLKLKKKLKNELEDERISYLGKVSYEEVIEWMYKSDLGVVVNQPVFTYNKALPNKLFEYMAHGLPVVCSNFNHWKKIVENNNVGICCNPTDLFDIAESIKKILLNKKLQNSMSKNGLNTVKTIYNLEKEILTLIKFYKEIYNEQ